MAMWTANLTLRYGRTVIFAKTPEAGRFRLLIEEYEHVATDYVLAEGHAAPQTECFIYAEVFELDGALIGET